MSALPAEATSSSALAAADGGRFWGCRAWPGCSYTLAHDTLLESFAARVDDLEAEVATLESELAEAQRSTNIATNVDRELRRLIAAAHPDRWQGAECAAAITGELTRVRAGLKARS